MLNFTVIAGPNGAGKSTFSSRLSKNNALIFDPDKEKATIEKQYPDITDDAVQAALTRRYDQMELWALTTEKNLTVETNLPNGFLVERAGIFKKSGYRIRLIFMMLPNIESSMSRVNLRVQQKGHFVDAGSIRYNFNNSLSNLYLLASAFDEVMLVCAASDFGIRAIPERLLTIRDGELVYYNEHTPEWALPIVDQTMKILTGQSRGDDHRWGR